MIAQGGTVSRLPSRRSDQRRSPGISRRTFVPALALAAVLFAGCPPKVVRVNVPPEDIVRSNQAVKEADLAFTKKDYYAALIKYLEASRLNPNSHFVYNKLGIAYSQLKFYTEASAAFQRCMALDTKFSYAYNNLGSVYFAQNDLKKAEKFFKKAMSINPKAASFHINLGSAYLERKQLEKARTEWQKALALDPNVFSKTDSVNLAATGRSPHERYYFVARFYASMGEVDRAIENLQSALNAGFTDVVLIQTEKDFDRIRQDEKFIAFMKTAMLLVTPR